MSQLKKNKRSVVTLKSKLLNILMSNGKKNTAEKILFFSIKRIYKSQKFHLKSLLKLAFINATPVFKLNEQLIKKGKRKIKKQIPFFLIGDSNRIVQGFKTIQFTSKKTRQSSPFYKSLSLELVNLIEVKGLSIANNSEIKRSVLSNKRYLSKFRW